MSSPKVSNSRASESAPFIELKSGTKIGRYRIVSLLGKGGMGVVYKGRDSQLNRRVAIKFLPESVASDALSLRQFIQEAQAAARLNHRNVVHVYEIIRYGFGLCIVMEYIRGGSIESLLKKKGAFSWKEATLIVAEVCRGLAAAHEAGLIHRDIKPSNIMRTEHGQIKLADFGLVKMNGPSAVSLSSEYSTVGTPHYMSPEQCRSDPLDELTDIYSLGATYYALLVGKPPYPGDEPAAIMFAHCSRAVPDPRDSVAGIPEECAEIVRRSMAKQPAERYASAAEMLAALKSLLGLQSTAEQTFPVEPAHGRIVAFFQDLSQRQRRVGLVAVLLVLVGLVFLFGRNGQSQRLATASPAATSTQLDKESSAEAEKIAGVRKFRNGITSAGLSIAMDGPVAGLAFSPDGRWLAIGCSGEKGGLKLWDLTSGQAALTQQLRPADGVGDAAHEAFLPEFHGLAFSADGENLAAGGFGIPRGRIAAWDMKSKPEWLPELNAGASGVRALAYSVDDKFLAALIEPQPFQRIGIKIWDVETGQIAREFPVESKRLSAMAFHPRDSSKLAVGGLDGKVRFWNMDTGEVESTIETGISAVSADSRFSLAFSSDGKLLALAGGGEMQLWNVATGLRLRRAELPGGDGGQIAFLPGGKLLVSGSGNDDRGAITLWDRATFVKLHTFPGHTRIVSSLACSSVDTLVASGGTDNTLYLWDFSRWINENLKQPAERHGASQPSP